MADKQAMHTHLNLQTRERRLYPRVDTQLPAKIICPNGNTVTGTIENMSQSGIQLVCNLAAVNSFLPDGKTVPGQNSDIEIRFCEETTSDGRNLIRIMVRPITSRRASQDVYHIGLKYLGLTGKAAQRINKYIARASNAK